MATQLPVLTQRIWGAFNPTTGLIVGVQTSGEGIYQNIANALIGSTFASVRTATSSATTTVFTNGKLTPGDGAGGQFVFNPSDTSSGCVCTGTSAGTVLTVAAIQSGLLAVGQTLASSATGAPLATILSFGTGLGGPGTYNLSAPVNQPTLVTFLLDNNSTILVSADSSRWYLTPTVANYTTFNAPSGNPAIRLTTPTYTFGNLTDNPAYAFTGTGPTTFGGTLAVTGTATLPTLQGPITVLANAAPGTSLTWNLNSSGLGNQPDVSFIANQNAATTLNFSNSNAGTAARATFQTNNGTVTGSFGITGTGFTGSAATNTTNPCHYLIGFNNAYPFYLGSNGIALLQFNPTGTAMSGFGPTAAAFVDMTPDKGSWTTTLSGPWVVGNNPTGTLKWERQGTQVTVWCDAGITQNVTAPAAITASGLPAAITPSSNRMVVCLVQNGSSPAMLGMVTVNSGGTMTIQPGVTVTGANPVNIQMQFQFSATGFAGLSTGWSITYSL